MLRRWGRWQVRFGRRRWRGGSGHAQEGDAQGEGCAQDDGGAQDHGGAPAEVGAQEEGGAQGATQEPAGCGGCGCVEVEGEEGGPALNRFLVFVFVLFSCSCSCRVRALVADLVACVGVSSASSACHAVGRARRGARCSCLAACPSSGAVCWGEAGVRPKAAGPVWGVFPWSQSTGHGAPAHLRSQGGGDRGCSLQSGSGNGDGV